MKPIRDTHFANSAQALAKVREGKLMGIGPNDWTPTRSATVEQEVNARYAYDLACHIVRHINERDLALVRSGMMSEEDCVARLPDMEGWTNEGGKTNAQ